MIVLDVENISKQYRLGIVGNKTLQDDFVRWWSRIRGKEDPFLKVGEANDREKKGESEYVWSLKNIHFQVSRGEVLGIIGKNGAGKSTLLKILSKVTAPTTGSVKVKGRIASLLEVGTGFHPELTGRENIYLNGAILGMRKKEINRKFDEIVEFSGVQRYIDTPVKRYSSGMYVRLAFAVAAHLEPEILIIDEVLAVGDAEFQRKCLGKMKEVSGSGRTVLFVSHNMEAVKSLCDRVIYLENGSVVMDGEPGEVIECYLQKQSTSLHQQVFNYEDAPGNEFVRLRSIRLSPKREDGKNMLTVKSPLQIEMEYWNEQDAVATNLSLHLFAATGECVFNIITQLPVPILGKGLQKASCLIPGDLLNTGVFSVSIMVVKDTSVPLYNFEDLLTFEIEEERVSTNWHGKFPGFVRPIIDFKLHV
jgi:lipopolysaccharide transport system ATP-binding protein